VYLAGRAESPRELLRALTAELAVGGLWEQYKSFSVRLKRPARLLGVQRIRDIIVNVALPFLTAYAHKKDDGPLAVKTRRAYLLMPTLQQNRVLNEAVHRFLVPPSRGVTLLRQACQQQGLHEIYRNFCLMLHNDCKNCPFLGAFPVEDSGAAQ